MDFLNAKNCDAIQCYPLGESAIVVRFGDEISKKTNLLIRQVAARLDSLQAHGIREYVPAFTTITIYYNPLVTTYEDLMHTVGEILQNLPKPMENQQVVKKIPVCYNGPDLAYVAHYTQRSEDEIIRMHSANLYLVYMIGFVPGFPYLGGMDPRLATPRKDVPRIKIEAGSVGIAGEQTGIYPLATPGGWQIIGQTPLNLFDRERNIPALLQSGDRIRFVPIGPDEYNDIKEQGYGY